MIVFKILSLEKKISFILILSIFLSSVLLKIYYIDKHFSHPDDSGIALRILDEKSFSYLYHEKKSNFFEKNYNENIINLFEKIDGTGILKKGFKLFNIPLNTTAAPLQYIPTYFLLNEEMSLKEILFSGRILPLLFSIFSFLIILQFFKNINFNLLSYKNLPIILLVSLIINFSQEFFIFSLNMTTYSAAVLATAILLYFLSLTENYNKKIFILYNSLKISFLSILHYQIIFLFPAYYMTKFLLNIKKKNWLRLKFNIYESILSFILVVLFILPFIKLSWGGVDLWLRGENNEYFYYLNPEDNLLSKLMYLIKFFLGNFIQIFISMVSILNYESNFYFINYFFLSLFILGLIYSFNNLKLHFLNIFLILSILIVIFLVIINKQTLAPSRHYLFLLPIMVIYTGIGAKFLFRFDSILFRYSYTFCFIIIFSIILNNYLVFFKDRKDPYSSNSLTEIINKNDIENIFSYGFYPDLRLDDEFKKLEKNLFFSYHNFFLNEYDFKDQQLFNHKIKYKPNSLNNENVLFISKYFKISDDHIKKLMYLFKIEYNSFQIFEKSESSTHIDLEHNQSLNSGENNFYYYIVKFS